jgi:hypothetical protein
MDWRRRVGNSTQRPVKRLVSIAGAENGTRKSLSWHIDLGSYASDPTISKPAL